MKNSNQINVPQACEVMDHFKIQAASAVFKFLFCIQICTHNKA